jgi:hypothetical protein
MLALSSSQFDPKRTSRPVKGMCQSPAFNLLKCVSLVKNHAYLEPMGWRPHGAQTLWASANEVIE